MRKDVLKVLFEQLPLIKTGDKIMRIKSDRGVRVATIGYRLKQNGKRATIKVCADDLMFSQNLSLTLRKILLLLNCALATAGSEERVP